MGDKRFDQIGEGIYKSYPNACILWIDEVVNAELCREFESFKKELSEKRNCVREMLMFHGTSEEAMNNIVWNGFDPKMNKVAAYGKGTYFARDAAYSKAYAKPKSNEISFMMVCRVLVGKCCIGSSDAVLDTCKFDNWVDNIKDPSIVVTPYPNGAIPLYVIGFHRNAKKNVKPLKTCVP